MGKKRIFLRVYSVVVDSSSNGVSIQDFEEQGGTAARYCFGLWPQPSTVIQQRLPKHTHILFYNCTEYTFILHLVQGHQHASTPRIGHRHMIDGISRCLHDSRQKRNMRTSAIKYHHLNAGTARVRTGMMNFRISQKESERKVRSFCMLREQFFSQKSQSRIQSMKFCKYSVV